ncbi:hypothetical protein [Sporosarcina obsidiansis]|uniref:hypothetical protein n=1 Tax=Sporosarcina obsidiansis TaxID=2660748 RepID=UPI00129B9A6E|nr:hypothetical protein [Sporosarcina obsidiansis]
MNWDNEYQSSNSNNERQNGEDYMVVNEKELQNMNKIKQKKDKDKVREALIQASIKDNYELLKRLSKN